MASAVIGAGASIFGARKAAKAANAQLALQREQMNRLAGVQYNPFNVSGLGGAGVSFNDGNAQLNLGQFQGANNLFQNLFNQFSGMGLDQQHAAMQGFDQMAGGMQNQAAGLSGMFGQQVNDLSQNGFQRGLQDQLFGQAGQFLGNTDFSALRDEQLGLLRQLDSQREEQAFSKFQNQLQRQGMLGSSGGAQQMQSFFDAQNTADLQRKLSSIGLAQGMQAQNAQLGGQFLGLGSGLRGMEDQLLGGALDRFGATSQLAMGLNDARFQRGQGLFNQGMAGFQGQNALQQMLLGLGTFGANLGATQASTDLSAAGGAGQLSTMMGPSGGDMWGSFASTLGSNLLQGSGGFGNLWGGIKNLFGGQQGIATPASGPDMSATALGWGSNPFSGMFGG